MNEAQTRLNTKAARCYYCAAFVLYYYKFTPDGSE